MRPTLEQIRTAAYDRWDRRGRVHGFDRIDWQAAERQQRFAVNYRVIAADRLDSDAPRAIGDPVRRRCRFCGQAPPRTVFSGCVTVFPEYLGIGSPVAFDHCDDCTAFFAKTIATGLARFVQPFFAGSSARQTAAGIGVDAFKGLIQLALAIMPALDLDDHEDTVEWISNPDHDFDLNVFRDLTCAVHVVANVFPASWAALAKRTDREELGPALLFFLGTGHVVFQVPVPLGQSESDDDGATATVLDHFPPSPFGPEYDPIARVLLPIGSIEGVHKTALFA